MGEECLDEHGHQEIPQETAKGLPPCPFCGAKASSDGAGGVYVFHWSGCFLFGNTIASWCRRVKGVEG